MSYQRQQPVDVIKDHPVPPPAPPSVACCLCGNPLHGVSPHQPNRHWTPEQDAFIRRAHDRGASVKLIAWTLRTEASTVGHRLQALRKFGR